MAQFLQYLVFGVVSGAIYFVVASGLVVTYATSGVFNFAHGAIGMVAAFSYWGLHIAWHWPALPALLVVVVVGGPLAGSLLERAFMRRLQGAPVLLTIGVTIGLLLAIVGGASLLWNSGESREVIGVFSQSSSVGIFGAFITYDDVMIICVAIAVAAGMWALLHRTRLGIAMRAVVDDPELVALSGISAGAASRAGWMLGCALAALGGVLFVDANPSQPLAILTLTLLVVTAYGAAIIGRLRSLPLTLVGAVVLGIAVNMVGYLPQSWQNDVNPEATAPMILLFVVLIALPQRRLRTVAKIPAVRMPVASLRTSLLGAVALIAAGVVAGHVLSSNDVVLVSSGVAFAIIGLSLVPLSGYAGQISCCQLTFAGVGAFTMAKIGGGDSPLGLLAAVIVPAMVGALIALPAIRFQGLYLALGTLAFAAAMDTGFFQTTQFGGFGGDLNVGRAPVLMWQFGSGGTYLVLLAVVYGLAAVGVLGLRRSRFGRRLVASADSSVAAATAGVHVARTRLAVFALSAGLAGLGGALLAGVTFIAEPNDYQMLLSLSLLLLVVVWGVRSVSGVLVAGLLFFFVPDWLNQNFAWLYLLTGLGAIGISRNPEGVIGGIVSRFGGSFVPKRATLEGGGAVARGIVDA